MPRPRSRFGPRDGASLGSVPRVRALPALAGLLVLAGCGQGTASTAAAPATVTATVTETVVVTPEAAGLRPEPSSSASPEPPPMIDLTVHTDGCGLVREDVDESLYENLGWSIVDADGFEVLQRNALGETHYRYFQGGSYTAALTAWDGEKYAPVSRTVEITC